MAQAPAPPKRARAVRLAAASVAPGLARRLVELPSERAALAGRSRPLGRPDAPVVVFLIPLVGRHHVGDWGAVSARLARTVESFRRQSAPNWRALICGQNRAEGLPEDERVTFLPFETPVEGNDKWDKLAALARALRGLGVAQGYAMPFDADDLLAPGVVKAMVEGRAPGGYLVTRGYVHDAGSGLWAEARPQSLTDPWQKAFWKLCGSCAAFGFDLRKGTEDVDLIGAIAAHEHRMFPYLARLAGRRLTPLTEPSALYIVNHGENFGARRGRVGFKTRFVERYALPEQDAARVRALFG